MRRLTRFYFVLSAILVFGMLSSCYRKDPGPQWDGERDFSIVDFDRLEMGSAFNITVNQADFFSIHTRGDSRNLDDLEVFKDGGTLVMRFDSNRSRHHTTYVSITMPALLSANFSGASTSTIAGFSGQDEFDFYLSGASIAQLDVSSQRANLVVSGASNLTLLGEGSELRVDLSGASILNSYNWSAEQVNLTASGASQAKVFAQDQLDAKASGASMVYYRGNPSLTLDVSGSSVVVKD
jgi:Putative auto-transporter adhesin, head GIN domain